MFKESLEAKEPCYATGFVSPKTTALFCRLNQTSLSCYSFYYSVCPDRAMGFPGLQVLSPVEAQSLHKHTHNQRHVFHGYAEQLHPDETSSLRYGYEIQNVLPIPKKKLLQY